MIKITDITTCNWEVALRGMRNPMNSWSKSDSGRCRNIDGLYGVYCKDCAFHDEDPCEHYVMGINDAILATKLARAGSDHSKFLRIITVSMDITAPMYWWAEFDTYKVGTVRNSCSKMHKLLAKPFEVTDFSFDKVFTEPAMDIACAIVDMLNDMRNIWQACTDETQKKKLWYTILQLLPESYNQKSTVSLNYQVLRNIYHARKDHKLDEWREFCKMIEKLPYAGLLITDKEAIE